MMSFVYFLNPVIWLKEFTSHHHHNVPRTYQKCKVSCNDVLMLVHYSVIAQPYVMSLDTHVDNVALEMMRLYDS